MFNEVRLLDCVSYGSEFGQEFSTRIVTLYSGVERRNANWSAPLGKYSIIYTALRPEDHEKVRDAHMASMGAFIPFRFKDWTDYKVEDQFIGLADGAEQTLQLVKSYNFGPVELTKKISKPVMNTVTVYADGVEIPLVTVDYILGTVTFTASVGARITWSGEFDVPVRFVDDQLDVEPITRVDDGFALSCDVDLIEVRL